MERKRLEGLDRRELARLFRAKQNAEHLSDEPVCRPPQSTNEGAETRAGKRGPSGYECS